VSDSVVVEFLQQKLEQYAARIAKVRTELHWDEDTYKAWSEKLQINDDNNMALVRFAELDESRIQDMWAQMEQLGSQVAQRKKKVDEAVAERNACQVKLTRCNRLLSAATERKQDLATKWEKVIDRVASMDSDTSKLMTDLESAQAQLEDATERRQIEEAGYQRECSNLKLITHQINDIQSKCTNSQLKLKSAEQDNENLSIQVYRIRNVTFIFKINHNNAN
jgi:chromosome segregation ATPase